MLERLSRFVTPEWDFRKRGIDDTLALFRPPEFEVDWAASRAKSRTLQYQLNAWAYLAPLLFIALQERQDPAYARQLRENALAWALDWIKRHRFNAVDPTGSRLENKFAWYDMATGLRAAVLGHLIELTTEDPSLLNDDSALLLQWSAEDHLTYLRDERLLASHSNHGFYQSMGLFCLVAVAPQASQRPDEDRDLAITRILKYLKASFSSDGVHLEHSPIYHSFMIRALRSVAPLLDENAKKESVALDLFDQMQEAQSAMFTPSGLLVPFGDSSPMASRDLDSIDPRILGNLSQKLSYDILRKPEHARPNRQYYASQEAGFASFKHASPKAPLSADISKDAPAKSLGPSHYLAVASWHHSSVHKQVDDGTCVWFENDVPILFDPGRFAYEGTTSPNSELRNRGYFYAHPSRVFVESAQAHNTVEIDQKSDNRRQAVEYGSGIVCSGFENGVFVHEIEIIREPAIIHRRLFIYTPGKALFVIDELENLIESQARDYSQWWQLYPAWQPKDMNPQNRQVRFEFTGTIGDIAQTDDGFEATLMNDGLDVVEDTGSSSTKPSDRYIERTYQPAAFDLMGCFTAFASDTADTRKIEVRHWKGEKSDPERLRGWTSLYPGELIPASAIEIQPEATADPITLVAAYHTIDKSVSDGVQATIAVGQARGGFRDLVLSIGNDEQVLTEQVRYRRRPKTLEVLVGHKRKLIFDRTLTTTNRQAQALMRARAALASGESKSKVSKRFENAVSTGSELALKEYAQFCKQTGQDKRYLSLLEQYAALGSGEGTLKLALALKAKDKSVDWKRVIELLETAASKGYRLAHFHLAEIYEDRNSPYAAPDRAETCYKAAAQLGHALSMVRIAALFKARGDLREMIYWLEEAAKLNNREAQLELGKTRSDSASAYYDLDAALTQFEAAAEHGSAAASYRAAQIYGDAKSPKYDATKQRRYLQMASDSGSGLASFRLAELMMKSAPTDDREDIIKLLQAAIDAGVKGADSALNAFDESSSDLA